jgi:hypothetical protein
VDTNQVRKNDIPSNNVKTWTCSKVNETHSEICILLRDFAVLRSNNFFTTSKLFLSVLFNPGEPYITSLRNWVAHVISCRQTFAKRGYDPKGNANSNQHKCPFCQKIWNKPLGPGNMS